MTTTTTEPTTKDIAYARNLESRREAYVEMADERVHQLHIIALRFDENSPEFYAVGRCIRELLHLVEVGSYNLE